jgi:hypothetical protein
MLDADTVVAECSLRTVSASLSRCSWAVHSASRISMTGWSQWHGGLLKAAGCALLNPKPWVFRFMKLRLDRVLKLELTGLSRQEVFQSGGPVPDFTPPEKWTAPYSPYRKGASVRTPFASQAAILVNIINERIQCSGPSTAPGCLLQSLSSR